MSISFPRNTPKKLTTSLKLPFVLLSLAFKSARGDERGYSVLS